MRYESLSITFSKLSSCLNTRNNKSTPLYDVNSLTNLQHIYLTDLIQSPSISRIWRLRKTRHFPKRHRLPLPPPLSLSLRPRRSLYRATILAPRGAGVGLLSLRRARTRRVPYFSFARASRPGFSFTASLRATPPSSPRALRSVCRRGRVRCIYWTDFVLRRALSAYPRLPRALSLVLPHLPPPPAVASNDRTTPWSLWLFCRAPLPPCAHAPVYSERPDASGQGRRCDAQLA